MLARQRIVAVMLLGVWLQCDMMFELTCLRRVSKVVRASVGSPFSTKFITTSTLPIDIGRIVTTANNISNAHSMTDTVRLNMSCHY